MRISLSSLFRTLALGAWVALPTAALSAPDPNKPAVAEEYTLPKEKDAVVISLDTLGGLTTERISKEPILSIYADGRVKIPACYKGQKPFEGKISPAELQELLSFAIGKQKFFEYDVERVREKLARLPPLPPPTDSIVTTIRIQANGQTKEASSSGYNPRRDPDEVQRLAAVVKRLEQFKSLVQMGGKPALDEYLKQANARLKETYPDALPLEAEHITSAVQRNDGSRSIEFRRVWKNVPGKLDSVTDASIYVPAGGEPRVQVHYEPAKAM